MDAATIPALATLVGAFEDRYKAEQAVDALEQAGFKSDEIGYVIRGAEGVAGGMLTDAIGAKDGKGVAAGALTGGVIGGVLATVVSLAIPPVGPVLVGGLLAAFFGGAIAGTAVGGIFGALTGLDVSEHEARFYEAKFNEGQAIVAVKAGQRFEEAADILRRFGGEHVHREAKSPIQTEGYFNTP